MHSKLIANWPVRHNGERFRPGDEVKPITRDEAEPLVIIGAASWSAVLPPADDDPVTDDDAGEKKNEETNEAIDWEEESKQYHKGFGRYDIPGVGLVQSKEAAIEALKTQSEQ